jgi:aryl-alcohol dehydrogenase-like predicted oxidoreductase
MDIDPRFKKETLKLALGTVQFGLNYGINNAKGTPATEELSSILNTAAANGINYLDTASGYGDAESRLSWYEQVQYHF